jgi:arylsulfatase A-like enzyme/lysophospholipase L1-like esterase
VLLIGDSIRGGYGKGVQQLLAGKAEVSVNAKNAQYTGWGLKKIDEWLGDGKWDVIHFNWGLWDMYGWEYFNEDRSPAKYEERLELLVSRMKKTGAKLIWATTTPACPEPEKAMRDRFNRQVRITPSVEKEYQDAALRVMKKHQVAVNDLYALMLPDLKKFQLGPDNVHFNEAGCEKLAQQVAKVILQQLDSRHTRPNLIHIMADELGYYEPAFMGGKNLQTPNLDRLAAEGMVFKNMFGGSSVCAPTRCCFLTGKHSGHSSVRANGGGTPLRADETTIAAMLKPLGYATGGFGKWGCGGRGSTGVPEKHGFDIFLGYYDQVHAHTYYPPYLIQNSAEVPLAGNDGKDRNNPATYAQYVIHDAAKKFIRENATKPFFAYLPYNPPHGSFHIPDSDPALALYKDKDWPADARRYAAMVTMLDRQVGEILALLKELGIEQNTLVCFSGDNGGADYFVTPQHPRGVHSANKHPETGVEYRGNKGTLYEGGLRVPFVARWPGKIAPGSHSDLLAYFPDLLPTFAEAAKATVPEKVDGISILPTLTGQNAAQKVHDYLYWENYGWTAIRQGTWRAVKPDKAKTWELYDLASDPSESKDLAAAQPDILAKLTALATAAHEPVREGTFASTDLHERDRRSKYGKQDDDSYIATPIGISKKRTNKNK